MGFVTMAPGAIRADDFPSLKIQRLPKYPLPILRLARLAVDRAMQGRRVGSTLLRYVFLKALEMAKELGCIGVVVDSKPQAVGYYSKFGFETTSTHAGRLQDHPESIAMFLDIGAIRSACEKG